MSLGFTPSPVPGRGFASAVASGHPLATEIGLGVLADEGNAVDAAVAAAFALMVLMPEACGVGGDAFALVADPMRTTAFNGSGRIPTRWDGALDPSGAGAATVPGAVAALGDIHQRYGVLPWRRLLRPAIALAANGIPMADTLIEALERQRHRLDISASQWKPLRWLDDRRTPVTQDDLAATLTEIADHGPRSFYEGAIANRIVESTRQITTALDAEDLRTHETVVEAALSVTVRDTSIEVSPPVSQAAIIPFALAAVSATGSTMRAHLLSEALEEGFRWRPDLAGPAGAAALPWGWSAPGLPARRRGDARGTSHTTSVNTADGHYVVSLLISVFHDFGSCFLVPDLGFFLNDRMTGMLDSRGHDVIDRPVHTLSPVVIRQGGARIGLSTPGADAQVQVLAQALDAVLHEGSSWASALSRPRWRLQGSALVVEEDMDRRTVSGLTNLGHDIVTVPSGHRSMGAVTLAGSTPGGCVVLADGRRGNSAGGMTAQGAREPGDAPGGEARRRT